MAREGRQTQAQVGTTPGKILLLALLANAPLLIAFVLGPVFSIPPGVTALRIVAWVTPALATASLAIYLRANTPARNHRAARMGLALAITALSLWLLAMVGLARGR